MKWQYVVHHRRALKVLPSFIIVLLAIGDFISDCISIRMSFVPVPCCGKGIFQISELSLPFQLLLNLGWVAVHL